MRIVLLLILVVVLAAPASAQVTVNGDAAAWREVMAAYQRLEALRTYRMKFTGVGVPGAGAVTEVVNPDRSRTVVDLGQGGMEFVTVGKDTRTRLGNAAWQCQGTSGKRNVGGLPINPREAKGEVAVSKLGVVVIAGARTVAYQFAYSKTATAQPTNVRLYVLADGGLPRRSEVLDKDEKVTVTIDFYDFNAPITIELPRCG